MIWRLLLPPLRYRHLALLGVVTATVIALGWIIARDLRRSADDADRLFQHVSQSLTSLDELQFSTQEVRRILLYSLHTTDANLQLQYAEQSRTADAQVAALLAASSDSASGSDALARLRSIREAWTEYLRVRDDVIGLILEGSLPEAVALDEQLGTARFNDVRSRIADLKQTYEAEAAKQVVEAQARTAVATQRLTLLVLIALVTTTVGVLVISRRNALESLLRIEAHKGSILEAVPDPILSMDAAGKIVELNEAAERAFGVSRSDALGQALEATILPQDHGGLLKAMFSLTGHTARVVWPRLQTTGRRRDGTEFPMELAAVTHTAGGERVCTLHISDLTERHRNEEQLRHAKEAAEVADRAKSDFLATMSHELRTPLVGVIGAAELLQNSELTVAQRELVSMLRSSATALLGLVSDILDYSRIEAGMLDLEPSSCPVRDCVEEALDPVSEMAARKGLDLGYLIDPGVPSQIVADGARIKQVLLNLLSNAVKFTEAGEVAVLVGAHITEEQQALVRIRVRDTGCGIPSHLHGRLFQRFSRIQGGPGTKPGGAGLGLAISDRLSRLLGGSMSVESAPGAGSTFTFVFRGRLDEERAREDRVRERRFEGLRLLVVAGAGIVCEQLQALLRGWGANVTTVAPDAAMVPPSQVEPRWDAVLYDGDVVQPSAEVVAAALRAWLSPDVPLLRFTRLRSIGFGTRLDNEHLLLKPLKARAVHDTLCAAVGIAAEPPAERPAPRPPDRFPSDAIKILLVEDNAANRRVVELMINELGLRTDIAQNGLVAVEAARERQYDVILMDLQMPGIDGFEATRQIRAGERGARPTIIALTANVVEGEEARCRAAGMDGYLPKPLKLDSLAAVLLPLASRNGSPN